MLGCAHVAFGFGDGVAVDPSSHFDPDSSKPVHPLPFPVPPHLAYVTHPELLPAKIKVTVVKERKIKVARGFWDKTTVRVIDAGEPSKVTGADYLAHARRIYVESQPGRAQYSGPGTFWDSPRVAAESALVQAARGNALYRRALKRALVKSAEVVVKEPRGSRVVDFGGGISFDVDPRRFEVVLNMEGRTVGVFDTETRAYVDSWTLHEPIIAASREMVLLQQVFGISTDDSHSLPLVLPNMHWSLVKLTAAQVLGEAKDLTKATGRQVTVSDVLLRHGFLPIEVPKALALIAQYGKYAGVEPSDKWRSNSVPFMPFAKRRLADIVRKFMHESLSLFDADSQPLSGLVAESFAGAAINSCLLGATRMLATGPIPPGLLDT